MPSLITRQITTVSVLSLLVGGYLALTCQDSLAQTAVPELQPAVEFDQNNQNYQTSQLTQMSQYGQNFERYIVYIDSDNSQILQRVRQIESNAYIRPYNGRNIIQSGVFSKPINAQQRVRELELNGITGARILGFSNPEQIAYYSGREVPYSAGDNFRNVSPSIQQEQAKYYYVIIPTSNNNLRSFGQEIQQKINGNTNVFMRTQPRGAHIAVGGFRERQEAEQWNNYLQNLGYGNARVYYGR